MTTVQPLLQGLRTLTNSRKIRGFHEGQKGQNDTKKPDKPSQLLTNYYLIKALCFHLLESYQNTLIGGSWQESKIIKDWVYDTLLESDWTQIIYNGTCFSISHPLWLRLSVIHGPVLVLKGGVKEAIEGTKTLALWPRIALSLNHVWIFIYPQSFMPSWTSWNANSWPVLVPR